MEHKNENETAIIPIAENALEAVDIVELANQAEKRIEAINKIKRIALAVTNRHDWVDQNGKPYLQVSGAEKIARLFGISWRIDEPQIEQEEGGYWVVTYKGYFSLGGTTIEAIGTRSSKDPFFRRYDFSGGGKVELPPSQIDKGDVKKAAYTNCIGNGITRLLGLRNLTYTDLEEIAKIKADEVGKVEYKKAGKTQEKISSEKALFIDTTIAEVKKREGETKGGKPYTLYTITDIQGNKYTTFSETLALNARDAKMANIPVRLGYTDTGKGLNLETIDIIPEGENDNG